MSINYLGKTRLGNIMSHPKNTNKCQCSKEVLDLFGQSIDFTEKTNTKQMGKYLLVIDNK